MKWRVKVGLTFLCVVLGLCSSWGSVAWLINRYAQHDETRPADAAIVLGAAVARGRPWLAGGRRPFFGSGLTMRWLCTNKGM